MLAALTRATIKPKIMLKFWSKVPAISKVIGNDKNVLFKMGLGEIPWFHQVTFSIWPNAQTMADFARKDGPHAKAIKSVREGNWFSEELYARFEVKKAIGKWCGKSVI
jgi:spheroidene monooxygenase